MHGACGLLDWRDGPFHPPLFIKLLYESSPQIGMRHMSVWMGVVFANLSWGWGVVLNVVCLLLGRLIGVTHQWMERGVALTWSWPLSLLVDSH